MKIFGATDKGRVRSVNQDAFIIVKNNDGLSCAFGVADGLGGHNAGEVASDICVKELENFFHDNSDCNYLDLGEDIIDKIMQINNNIIKLSELDESKSGMGTTLTLCVLTGKNMKIFHVGDSRCYIVNESTFQVTTDHSLVEEMVKRGDISRDEAKYHPNRNIITNAIGTYNDMYVETYDVKIDDNDIILVCSDGLTEYVDIEDFYGIIKSCDCEEDAVKKFIDNANRKGGSDNITVVLCSKEAMS